MEAALVNPLVSLLRKSVLSAVAEEVVTLQLVQRDLAFIREEFEMMGAILRAAHDERGDRQVPMTWVKQARDVANDVEDIIHGTVHLKKTSWWRLPSTLSERRRFAKKVKELTARVEDLNQLRHQLVKISASKPEEEELLVAARKPALQNLHGIPTGSASSFDLPERFGGVQAKNSSEAGENCSPSFDLRSVPSSPSLIPGSQWEKQEECIGFGGFGKVYLGVNSEHGQFCAIKEVTVISDDPRSKEQVRQLHQEICLLKQWSHPNIVQYYDSIMTDTTLSIYMEHVSKGSIDKLLAKFGPFKESMIRSYTAQILSGLAFLHERRHIHRDIKGGNILVGPNNEVKLADFGLAKHIATLTAAHTSCRGTPWWMAPEVILSTYSGEGYNVSADIWSLGCTVIEMATGKPPLHGYGKIQAIFKIANDKTYIPDIPDVLSDEGKDFVKLCLQRDPKSRPSAAQLMDHPFIQNQGS